MTRSPEVWALLSIVLWSTTGCSGDEEPAGTTTDASAAAAEGGQSGADAGSAPTTNPGDGALPASDGGAKGDSGLSADAGGDAEQAGPDAGADPVCELPTPDKFLPNTSVGGGGTQFKESDHFRIYGNASDVETALKHLEAAHKCFVEDWCFRSPGRAVNSKDAPYYKFNVYAVGSLGSAAGVMRYDARAGLSYLEVLTRSASDPRVIVHELGHSLTLTEYGWVDQTRTGAWWETVANWVADTYLTSSHCEAARVAHGVAKGRTVIDLNKVIGQSNMLIVSNQNYYEAWPFLTYLTTNPDGYPGLGRMALPNLFRNHPRNNETPLHVLERIAAPVRVQTILGRYWAHMAYLDIGHPQAQEAFFSSRSSLNFANLDPAGSQTYRVKASRRPAYGGANIIPLKGTGAVTAQVSNLGNGLQGSNFTATLAVRSNSGSVRYVDLANGTGQATVGSGEEASLVVVNTPDTLIQYDAFQTNASSPEAIGLNYQVQLTGATPAN